MVDPEKTFTNSEILRKLLLKDYTKLYTTALSVQNFPLLFPTEFSTLFEEEKNKLDDKLKKEQGEDKCKTVTIAKYYSSMEELNSDNGKSPIYFDKKYDKTNYGLYFDKKYDKTNYGLLEENYGKDVMMMSSEELRTHITKDLMIKKVLNIRKMPYRLYVAKAFYLSTQSNFNSYSISSFWIHLDCFAIVSCDIYNSTLYLSDNTKTVPWYHICCY